jgi:hypothetical protein
MKIGRDLPFARITADCIADKVPLPEKLVGQFERIAVRLNDVWGTKEATEFLDELIFSKRGDRRGFPPEVAGEIVALKSLHQKKYGVAKVNVWDSSTNLFADVEAAPTRFNGHSIRSSGHRQALRETPEVPSRSVYAARKPIPEPNEPERRNGKTIAFPVTAARTVSAQTRPPASAVTARDEILEDAEKLLESGRIHSGIALFERLIALNPRHAPYPYLRLLDIYYEHERRGEFELVALRMSNNFGCRIVRWNANKEEYRSQLDEAAAELAQSVFSSN